MALTTAERRLWLQRGKKGNSGLKPPKAARGFIEVGCGNGERVRGMMSFQGWERIVVR